MIAIALLSLYLNSPVYEISRQVEGYVQGVPVTLEVVNLGSTDKSGSPLALEKQAADAFMEMRADMAKAGLSLRLNYAHRTMAQQTNLYKKNRKLASPPGLSTHQEGRAIDVSGCTKKVRKKRRSTPVCKWLKSHAAAYGFSRPTSKEPWHWEFSGRPSDSVASARF